MTHQTGMSGRCIIETVVDAKEKIAPWHHRYSYGMSASGNCWSMCAFHSEASQGLCFDIRPLSLCVAACQSMLDNFSHAAVYFTERNRALETRTVAFLALVSR